MSNPCRPVSGRKGKKNPKTVYFTVRVGKRIYAPRGGTVQRRKRGLAVVTSGGYRHRLYNVKVRSKLVGKKVRNGRWIGTATKTTVAYKRRTKDGKQVGAMTVVRKPVPPKPVTHRKPWNGSYPLTAGYRYSSGRFHGAWDLGMQRGVPLYAPFDGYVAQSNDGVPNQRPGYNPGSGSPSNYVYIYGKNPRGRRSSILLQHMSPGLKVRKGQKVRCGQLVGYSGNTGNSTADHAHVQVQDGWQPNRYAMYSNHSVCVYPPSKAWS